MKFIETRLKDVRLIEMAPFADSRGWFARAFCEDEFAAHGLETRYPQANAAFNYVKGTLRGMHWQVAPHAEVKVVRCASGAIHDVIVDLRSDSPTYLKWEGYELSFENMRQLYVPKGFAHGYQTLTDSAFVTYLHSVVHAPDAARGCRHDDPAFAIKWPLPVSEISEKDKAWADFRT